MSISRIFRSPRTRRAIAVSAVVLSMGGLVLHRINPATAGSGISYTEHDLRNAQSFNGPSLHGTFALSHVGVSATEPQTVFAELRLRTDESAQAERAPLSLAIVLDTSGSMSGEKLQAAKRSVARMIRSMHDSDEVALIQYDSSARVVQPLARVGDIRPRLSGLIAGLTADGGTNIPWAIKKGTEALSGASAGRARRLVLVSDGLDSTRVEAEAEASKAIGRDVTVSALGIGLDFDEAYLAAVSRKGSGNFAFVERANSLETFLARELKQAANTVARGVSATVQLPPGMQLVKALGAEASVGAGGVINLSIGSLPSNAERRVVLELKSIGAASPMALSTIVSWSRLNGTHHSSPNLALQLKPVGSSLLAAETRDPRVYARCVSALASWNQLEATEAYRRGDRRRAESILKLNREALDGAAENAPADVVKGLGKQRQRLDKADKEFKQAAPSSAAGRAAAKRHFAIENDNLAKPAF